MLNRRQFIKASALISLVSSVPLALFGCAKKTTSKTSKLNFFNRGTSLSGEWGADVTLSSEHWTPGQVIELVISLFLTNTLLPSLSKDGFQADNVLVLLTTERCFDSQGWLHVPSDEQMSTLITPTGLAIEGGNSGAISKYTGSHYRNVVDMLSLVPLSDFREPDATYALNGLNPSDYQTVHLSLKFTLPADTPPGIYRLRFDFGVSAKKQRQSLNHNSFASRETPPENLSLMYSPPIRCSGMDVSGKTIDATKINPRLYWILLFQYNSNGYRGVIAEEDKGHFAISDRNIIPDEVILPLYDNRDNIIAYNLEPEFRADTIDPQCNIPWNNQSGQLAIKVTSPDGKISNLGISPFNEQKGNQMSTGNKNFTAWKPQQYGRYTVEATGWIKDKWGNTYHGGGTYRFWIAKRLTMATATFQGMPYPVGTRYGRDIAFAPAVPADVTVKIDLYPNSNPTSKSLTYSGKATSGGIFGADQGMKPFVFDTPGEYAAHIQATYTDPENHLWICSMHHAGVVYSPNTDLVVHGKKVKVGEHFLDRGETHTEGYLEPGDKDLKHLQHINYPYNTGDVLLIASEGDGANKIEPVLTYELKKNQEPYDNTLQSIGRTNLRILTSNGMSPHLYPEYITDFAYYYGSAPRPGFPSRFLVGEDGVQAPYWPVSNSNFGGQYGASNNGDRQGDIYRLIGGVVLRPQNGQPLYGGYMANAFILPKGTNNNRIIAPGAEELKGADGRKSRFFLVSTRPGMVYAQGAIYVPAFQIDPILPVNIHFELFYPDGSRKTTDGSGDSFGSFAGSERWTLDQPGVYRYTVSSTWQGYPGIVPGLPDEGGYLFVLEKNTPMGANNLKLKMKNQQTFAVPNGLQIEGSSTSEKVYFAAVTPGAVVAQGVLPVVNGTFQYHFDPATIHQRIPIYDISNLRSGKPEIGRIIHLTFFAQEKADQGINYHSFARVIFRGTTAIYTG